jgi:hypothetical protein
MRRRWMERGPLRSIREDGTGKSVYHGYAPYITFGHHKISLYQVSSFSRKQLLFLSLRQTIRPFNMQVSHEPKHTTPRSQSLYELFTAATALVAFGGTPFYDMWFLFLLCTYNVRSAPQQKI